MDRLNDIYKEIARLQKEGAMLMHDCQVKSPEMCFLVLGKYKNKKVEHFIVITLDASHKIIKERCVSKGTLTPSGSRPVSRPRHTPRHRSRELSSQRRRSRRDS